MSHYWTKTRTSQWLELMSYKSRAEIYCYLEETYILTTITLMKVKLFTPFPLSVVSVFDGPESLERSNCSVRNLGQGKIQPFLELD